MDKEKLLVQLLQLLIGVGSFASMAEEDGGEFRPCVHCRNNPPLEGSRAFTD